MLLGSPPLYCWSTVFPALGPPMIVYWFDAPFQFRASIGSTVSCDSNSSLPRMKALLIR